MEVFVVMVKGTVTVFLSGDDAVQYANGCLPNYGVGDTKLIKCEVKLPKAKLGQALSHWCQEKPILENTSIYAIECAIAYEPTTIFGLFTSKIEADKGLDYYSNRRELDKDALWAVIEYPLLSKFSQEDFE